MARSVKEGVVEECSFNVYVISQTAEQNKRKGHADAGSSFILY